jgi:hypothetical protein
VRSAVQSVERLDQVTSAQQDWIQEADIDLRTPLQGRLESFSEAMAILTRHLMQLGVDTSSINSTPSARAATAVAPEQGEFLPARLGAPN